MPWVARMNSMPRMICVFLMMLRALREEKVHIDTWSSWLALVGIESTTEGKHSTLFSDAMAAAAQCTIEKPVFRPNWPPTRLSGRP
ncbi:hypothetical protein HR12_24240 [Microbacterium sp. SUBG005]|nr:hypothetical protein HR12_24240 [Microbacterium sp. SUBG005]